MLMSGGIFDVDLDTAGLVVNEGIGGVEVRLVVLGV